MDTRQMKLDWHQCHFVVDFVITISKSLMIALLNFKYLVNCRIGYIY